MINWEANNIRDHFRGCPNDVNETMVILTPNGETHICVLQLESETPSILARSAPQEKLFGSGCRIFVYASDGETFVGEIANQAEFYTMYSIVKQYWHQFP